jgi:hypothetical protein
LTEADRLIAGNPPDPAHRGLAALLDAATAPPSVEELAGETAAVARFVAAFRSAAAQPSASSRVRVRRSARMVAVKVAAGVAVLAAGGTAVAAETGSLPAGVQQFFATLGAPAPDGGPRPTATGAGHAPAKRSASPSPTPAPSGSGTLNRPAESTALDLCRAWDSARTDPRGKAMPAASRHALAAEAGGEHEIADFCTDMLSMSPSLPTSSASAGTGSDQGNPGGNDNGTGNAGGNDNSGNAGDNGNGGGNANGAGNGNGGNGNGGGNGDADGTSNGKMTGSPSSTPIPMNSPQP